MHLLLPLAAFLGIEVESLTDRVKSLLIINAVMILLALVGLGFLVAAGFVALAQVIGVIYAALSFAGAFLALALAVYVGTRISENRRRREAAKKRHSSEAGALVTTAALTALPIVLKSPWLRTLALPAAAIAAFLLVRNSSDKDE